MPRRAFSPRLSGSSRTMLYGPNMTPMVDVVMVILVFFMASAAIAAREWLLDTGLTPAARTGGVGPARFVITLSAEGRVSASGLGAEGISVREMVARVEALGLRLGDASTEAAVVIEPTPGVPWQAVVDLRAACETAGIDRVGIRPATSPG